MDAAKFAASVIRRHLSDPACRIFLFGSRVFAAGRDGTPLPRRARRHRGALSSGSPSRSNLR